MIKIEKLDGVTDAKFTRNGTVQGLYLYALITPEELKSVTFTSGSIMYSVDESSIEWLYPIESGETKGNTKSTTDSETLAVPVVSAPAETEKPKVPTQVKPAAKTVVKK